MSTDETDRERRKYRRLQQLGTMNPRCGMCGEADWRCMELHHVADHGRDDATVCLCRNCHRKVSDDQHDHPAPEPNANRLLDQIGNFLIGLADMLRLIIEKLYAFGDVLIERAAQPSSAETAQ